MEQEEFIGGHKLIEIQRINNCYSGGFKNNNARPLKEYLKIAQISIVKYAPKIKALHNDEDAISEVAKSLMQSDLRYDPEKTPDKKMYDSYILRKAVCGLIARLKQKHRTMSFSYMVNDDLDLSDVISSNDKCGLSTLLKQEAQQKKKQDAQEILNDSIITDKQRKYITEYYLNSKSYGEIAKEYNITKQCVERCIKKGLKALVTKYGNNNLCNSNSA